MKDRFLRACRRESVDTTPVWFMRQAGRYLPEYRALREKHPILDVIKTPELAVEVTLQPLRRFDLDAAIIFADILPPLEGMGLDFDFVTGKGPVIENPIRSPADVDALTVKPAEETLSFTLTAISLARKELDGNVPLIGFAGAPFTLASYAIEGGSSRNYRLAKTFMYEEPAAWHTLMEVFADVIGEYLQAQARAGAQALQLFDSWVGALGPEDYEEYVLPYSKRVLAMAGEAAVPVIHFGTGTAGMLELFGSAGGDVVSVDWRIHIDAAWRRLGGPERVAIQGNVEPVAMMAPWPELQRRAEDVLQRVSGRPGHIFNLGHGFLPQTKIENVERLVEFVHEFK